MEVEWDLKSDDINKLEITDPKIKEYVQTAYSNVLNIISLTEIPNFEPYYDKHEVKGYKIVCADKRHMIKAEGEINVDINMAF